MILQGYYDPFPFFFFSFCDGLKIDYFSSQRDDSQELFVCALAFALAASIGAECGTWCER